MTAGGANTVLETVVRVAMEATGASRGRLFTLVPSAVSESEAVAVVVGHGGDELWRGGVGGGAHSTLVGYVLATAQPQVLTSHNPASSGLCVPCIHDEEVVGVLELRDKAGDGPFSVDDMELASLFAGIAGAAIVGRRAAAPPDPGQLVGQLGALMATDRARYAKVARLVQGLLDA